MGAAQHVQEKEWHEELASMQHQQSSVAEEVQDLEREASRLRRTVADQQKQVTRAESKLKSIDGQRVDFRAQGERLVKQAAEHRTAYEEALAAAEKLRGKTTCIAADGPTVILWQISAGLLSVFLAWLLMFGR